MDTTTLFYNVRQPNFLPPTFVMKNRSEDFVIIWLDRHIDQTNDCIDMKHRLRYALSFSNTNLKLFNMIDECLKYILSTVHENILLITSGEFGERIVPQVDQCLQIISIYIFCIDREKHEKWSQMYHSKVAGVFLDKFELFKRLEHDVELWITNSTAISIFSMNNLKQNSIRDLNEENATFIWFQLLIDTLIEIPCGENAKEEMLNECYLEYKDNEKELAKINQFRNTYNPNEAIRWYTTDSFVYRLLNKALRTENIDIIFKFRFYIVDLYNSLLKLYNQCIPEHIDSKTITVYRGQRLSTAELKKIENNINKLISINTFFSTGSLDVAYVYSGADCTDQNSQGAFESVIFQIEIDSTIQTKPYANIKEFSAFKDEEEMLFSMGTVFQIVNVTNYTTAWLVQLALTGEEDKKLKELIRNYTQVGEYEEKMLEECHGVKRQTDHKNTLYDFGTLLQTMGDFERAEKYYRIMLSELPNNHDNIALIYLSIAGTYLQRAQYNEALENVDLATNIIAEYDSSNILLRAYAYTERSTVFVHWGKLGMAIKYRLEAIRLYEQFYIPQHAMLATEYTSLAEIYCYKGDYQLAFGKLFKARDILTKDANKLWRNKYLEWHASLHNTFGDAYYGIANYDQAILHYYTTVKNLLKYLPEGDRSLTETYRKIGQIYREKGDYDKALQYEEQALAVADLAFLKTLYLKFRAWDPYETYGG